MSEYNGCEYSIRSRGHNKWQWSVYEGAREIESGEVNGARQKAVDAAREVIDRFQEGRTKN